MNSDESRLGRTLSLIHDSDSSDLLLTNLHKSDISTYIRWLEGRSKELEKQLSKAIDFYEE